MTEILSPWQLAAADLQWSEHDEPFSAAFGDIYFSRGDGLAETEYVFLTQNRLAERWRALDPQHAGVFVIGETGFGTGLNFLSAWRLWRDIAPPLWRLHYVSVEKFPLEITALQHALAQWPQFAELGAILLAHYPPRVRDFHLRHLDTLSGNGATLQLLFGDATEQLNALHDSAAPELTNSFHVDAWFLDGFAPAKNPEMWQPALFEQIGRLSKAGTTFATFTVAGIVKRGMQDAGFAIEKFAGFGSKRQMLRGEFQQRANVAESQEKLRAIEYWSYPSPALILSRKPRVAIIGGGLAGTTTAHALAQRGCEVILLERETSLANAASGNPQGVLYTKLSPLDGMLNRFALTSYLFALDFYRPIIASNSSHGDFCGVLQLLDDQVQWQQLRSAFSAQGEWLEFVDAERASELSNCTIANNALWFSRAGWLSPRAICAHLIQHPAIDVRLDCTVHSLRRAGNIWHLETSNEKIDVDIVVIANAHSAAEFAHTTSLPLKAIRGQITELPSQYLREYPSTVICHEGYVAPNSNGLHIGATFDLNATDTTDTALRSESHRHNLETLHAALPNLLNEAPDIILAANFDGRVGYRCTTPDYMPIVGAVADANIMRSRYAKLAKNANARINEPGAYLPGLYINVGHGSRGLTSTPLCAELLASLIANEPRPFPRDLRQALSPARFILRDLIRGR